MSVPDRTEGVNEVDRVAPLVAAQGCCQLFLWRCKGVAWHYGRGRVLEGLELRWGLVSNILHALTAMGRWRLDGTLGPMHKWYDPRADGGEDR